MNRSMALVHIGRPLGMRLSRLQTNSSSPTTRSLLSDPQLQAQLSSHSATATTSLARSHPLRLELLSRLSALTGRPIASDAFLKLDNAEDMADWYAKNVRGHNVREHGRNLMEGVLGGGAMKELEDGAGVADKKAELERKLPSNLDIDARTTEKQKRGNVQAKTRNRRDRRLAGTSASRR
eukprot:GFKZ01009183.1.p1 GENE.GFKZ01009183.1~~GFKZ01009183.1.p1  ORF type:complete len:180 (-),score=20.75 GFKZ01009183.1:229-768(-)